MLKGLPLVLRRDPDFRLQVAQGLVLESAGTCDQVGEGIHFLARVEVLLRPIEPERATGFRREMPRDDFAQVGVELGLGFWIVAWSMLIGFSRD
jgi:hypothetical protein